MKVAFSILPFLAYLLGQQTISAQSISPFENVKDLPNRTGELQELIEAGDGHLMIPKGVYRITKTLEFSLQQVRSTRIASKDGPVTLVMDSPGPALRIIGSHKGTAGPKTFESKTWSERMPEISGIEILGSHPEATGIELRRCLQPIISKVAVRGCLHGIHLVERNRNVVISDCHLYENLGIGLYLDDVNLHQINVSNSHISYNRKGGIVVRDGNVRNLQITGCDLEANMPGTVEPTTTANILLDVSGSKEDRSKSIAEVAVTGCTIQHSANYGSKEGTIAEGGANIRLLGKKIWPIDSVAITGNVISDTTTSIDLSFSMDVTITGNTFFAPKPDNFRAVDCLRVAMTGNTFNPRQFVRPGTIRFLRCKDCVVSNCILNDFATRDGSLILDHCEGFQIRGNVLTGCQSGVVITNSKEIKVHDNLIRNLPESAEAIRVDEASEEVEVR